MPKWAVPTFSRMKSKALSWTVPSRGGVGTEAGSSLTESRPGIGEGRDFGRRLLGLVDALPVARLDQALTHSSWVSDRIDSYERLEFLGDSVLGLAVVAALYERYPCREEGELARVKAFVVSRASCVHVAQRLGVPELLSERAPAPEQKKREEAAASPTILGNVLEALIGACYVTFGYDRTAAAVVEAFDAQVDHALTAHVDHKTTLQETLAPRGLQPVYRLVGEEGPPHARTFTSEVDVDGQVRGRGEGRTIKMSEQAAAHEALDSLNVAVKGI